MAVELLHHMCYTDIFLATNANCVMRNSHHNTTTCVLKNEHQILIIWRRWPQRISPPKWRWRKTYPQSWRQFAILPAIPFQCHQGIFLVPDVLCFPWRIFGHLGSLYWLRLTPAAVFVAWRSRSCNTLCNPGNEGWSIVTVRSCEWSGARGDVKHMCCPGGQDPWWSS